MAHPGVFAPLRASIRTARLHIEPAASGTATASGSGTGSSGASPEVLVAANPLRRLRGLILSGERALLIVPCNSVHGIGMTRALETAYLDRNGVVLRTALLRPWRAHGLVRGSVAVLEAEPGSFECWGISTDARIIPRTPLRTDGGPQIEDVE